MAFKNEYPIKGKIYKIIKGKHAGFLGECVGIDLTNELPVILEDMEFNGKAVKLDEIEETIKQPSGKYIDGNAN